MQTCSFCGEIKPLFEFSRRTKDLICKSCTFGRAYELLRNHRKKLDRIANPEKYKKYENAKTNNPQYKVIRRAIDAKYRAKKLQATPPWLTNEDYEKIKSIYLLSQQISETTGIPHEVDHIIPLQGINVSGLHVPWNLRPLPKTLNSSKNNKLNQEDALAFPFFDIRTKVTHIV